MKTAGKFYIWQNTASVDNWYWSQPAQNWTSKPQDATFFDSRSEADDEAEYANDYGPGEAVVLQATRDLVDA